MARVGVRVCDRCERWDSAAQAVKRVPVVGPRLELCASCRISLLVEVGMAPTDAISYVLAQDGIPPDGDPDQLELIGTILAKGVGEETPDDSFPPVPTPLK